MKVFNCFEKVIGKYVDNSFVEIIDWRGVKGTSTYYGIMDSCYQTYHDQYDWLLFYELDEFLYLKNYKNIKSFLINKVFDKCESIQLNWVHMSDNNQIFYENKPLYIFKVETFLVLEVGVLDSSFDE